MNLRNYSMSKADKIEFILNNNNIQNLISKLSDITKISDNIRIKIDPENILIYGLVGEAAILAFKSHLLNTIDYLDTKNEFNFCLDFVLMGARKFTKNLGFFEYKEKTKMIVQFKDNPDMEDVKNVRVITIQDSHLKISTIGDQPNRLRDINKNVLSQKFNPSSSNWKFSLDKNSLDRIKKISNNSDEKIISATIKDGDVYFSEGSKWSLLVGKTEYSEQVEINFDNSYLSNIVPQGDNIDFFVFDTTILFKETELTNLLVSFEQVA